MKSIFSLAIISKEGQSIEDLIKPYVVNPKESIDYEQRIKEKRNFITGFIFGDIDEDYAHNDKLIVKNQKLEFVRTSSAPIKNLCWEKMIEEANNELRETGVKIKLNKNNFFLTGSLITPDKKWHGRVPINVCDVEFENKKTYDEYTQNYYENYIEAYKEDCIITIITCNF